MTVVKRIEALSKFTCLGDRCEDTCCMNWSMQVDEATLARYKKEAPDLLDAVDTSQDGSAIMRKNPATHHCIKLEGGLCGIHKEHGDRFLGDACHFYPRVTRALGDQIIMSATLSCPEIARLSLLESEPCHLETAEVERLPHTVKNYLPEGMDANQALAIHQAFIDATKDTTISVEQIFLRISSASRSLERIEQKNWPAMAAFYLQHADSRIPKPERLDTDPFNLLHALCGLIVATHKPASEYLKKTIAAMEHALACSLDWQNVQIQLTDQSLLAYRQLQGLWFNEAAEYYTPALRRWLQMQMSLALYPFSGFGGTLTERITIIGVRLATVKLCLLSSHSVKGEPLSDNEIARILQCQARFLDHLGDPAFSLQVYTETGWIHEPRMFGLLLG